MSKTYKKGDVIYVIDHNAVEFGIQGGNRPYLVISNDIFNFHSPVLNCVPLTTQAKKYSPVHFHIHKDVGLPQDSYVLCEQIKTISKKQVEYIICSLPQNIISEINKKLSFQLSL